MDHETEVKNKSWNLAGTFDNYESASILKENLTEAHSEVKIKKGVNSNKQIVFRVKYWDPQAQKQNRKTKNKQASK
jgi:hypothetical protein